MKKQRFCKDCRFSEPRKVDWHDDIDLHCVHPVLFDPVSYDPVDGTAIQNTPRSCTNERDHGIHCGWQGSLFEPLNYTGPAMTWLGRLVRDVKEFFGL